MNLAGTANAILSRFMILRYLLASVCALSCDMLLFLTLLQLDVAPPLAAVAGYASGLLLHWRISVRYVFTSAQYRTDGQILAFAASAVVGSCITVGTISVLGAASLSPTVAKLIAIPLSFLSVYLVRKHGVFAAR